MTLFYNWSAFYNELCQLGPDLLVGIPEDVREVIKEISATEDMFWSDNLEEFLAEGVAAGSIRDGVLQALDQWRMNVVDQLDANFGIPLDMNQISINASSPMIEQLVEAASQG